MKLRKVLASILALCMVLSTMSFTVFAAADLEISTVDELMDFAAKVNGGDTYAGKTVVLTSDIDLDGVEWTPIGISGDHAGFQGTFDGNGKTISNLKVSLTDGEYHSAGLFGSARYATIKNFTMENVNLTNYESAGNSSNGTAAVVGSAQFPSTIENVTVKNVIINSNRLSGGIAGYFAGTIKDCSVENLEITAIPNLNGSAYDNGDKIGGIVGYLNSGDNKITSCQAENISLKGYRDIGGIVGCGQSNADISENTVAGEIKITVDQETNSYGEKAVNAGIFVGRENSSVIGEKVLDESAQVTITITDVAGNTTTEVTKAVCEVNGVKYFSLAEAIAKAQAGDTVTIYEGTYEMPSIKKQIKIVGVGDVTVTNQISVSQNTVEIENIDFINPNGNCLRWCYANGDMKFTDCSFIAQVYAVHFDGGSGTVTFDGCEFSGWTSFGSKISKVTFNDCKFRQDSTSGYNYVRVYQDADLKRCTFDGTVVGMANETAVLNVNSCATADGRDLLDVFEDARVEYGTIYIDGELVGRAKIGNTSYNTLAEALAATGTMSGDVTIDLYADVELSYGAREAYGAVDTDSITINGNGYTLALNQTDSDWSSIGMANADGKLKMNNINIVKKGNGATSGAWNTHAILFNVDVEIADSTINNSIKLGGNNSKLTNVDINEANGYYCVWIEADNESVTIEGGKFTATNGGRGIKIADQYVAETSRKQVKLSVTDTEFETANKAAVLVSSTAGAAITADGYDISKVAEDSVNFTWVDEDWAAYANLVTVNGEPVVVESKVASTLKIEFEKTAVEGEYDIVLSAHNGDLYDFVSADISFENISESLGGTNGRMPYTIIAAEDLFVAKNLEKADTYAFRLADGKKRITKNEFVLGTIKFANEGTPKMNILSAFVVATEIGTNIPVYYSTDSNIVTENFEGDKIAAATGKVTVNVAYNLKLTEGVWDDNQISVTLKDSLNNTYTANRTGDSKFVFENVLAGRIVVTLKAPGFRTYTYDAILYEDAGALGLNFWNNVKRGTEEEPLKKIDDTNVREEIMAQNFVVGDIVMDYIVDEYDLAAVTSYYGMYDIKNNDKYIKYDLNRDGQIDIMDVHYVLHTFER